MNYKHEFVPQPEYCYYSIHSDTHSIESVWDWISESTEECYMYKARIVEHVTWVAQLPRGKANTMFALRYSEHIDLL